MRKPSAPAYPVTVIPLAPPLLVVLLLVVLPLVVLVTLVQETLEGTEKFCASVRSAHWVGKKKFSHDNVHTWRMSK